MIAENEIIIICDGSNSGDIFIGFNGILSSTMGKIAHSKDVDTWFLKLFLELNFDIFNNAKKGAAIPHLDINALYNLKIPLPTIGEQRKIVEKIEKLFAKIDEASRLRAESLTASAALLPSALHQIFTTQTTTHKQQPYKPENVGMSQTKQKAWKEKKIGEICDKPQYGYTASAQQEKVGPKLLRITDIQNSEVKWDNVPYCKCDNSEKYELKSDDIVFARTGATVGKSFLIESIPEKSVFASYLIRLRAKESVLPKYLYAFFQSPDYWQQIAGHQAGGAQPNVNASKLSEIKIPLPSVAEQKKIVEYLDALSQKTRALRNLQSQTAADFSTLRQSVLSQAFSGNIQS